MGLFKKLDHSIVFRLWMLLTLFFFLFGTYRNRFYKIESDGKYYYQYVISSFFDHDLDFSNNYLYQPPSWMGDDIDQYHLREGINPTTGRPGNIYSIGPAILWFPFFVMSYYAAVVLNHALHLHIVLDGWSRYFHYSVMYSSVLYMLMTLGLVYRLLRRQFSDSASKLAVALLLLGTNVLYYTVLEPSMSHVYDLFTAVLFLYLYCVVRESPERTIYYVGMGLAGGLHVLVRTQNVSTLAIVSAFLCLHVIEDYRATGRRILLANLLAFAVVASLAVLPVPLINKYLYGGYFVVPQGRDFLHLSSPNLWGVLFSTRNGLFSHHPVMLFGIAGFAVMAVRSFATRDKDRSYWLMLAATLAIQVWLNASAADWWAGASFGQRRLIGSFLPFAYGFGQAITFGQERIGQTNTRRLIIFFIAINFYLMLIHDLIWPYEKPHNILEWIVVFPLDLLFQFVPPLVLTLVAASIFLVMFFMVRRKRKARNEQATQGAH